MHRHTSTFEVLRYHAQDTKCLLFDGPFALQAMQA